MLNCKTKVTKIHYLCQRNTFTSRTQFMALFFRVRFHYPLFSLKLFSKCSFGVHSCFGSLGRVRVPGRWRRAGMTPGPRLFPASSPDGWCLAACLLVVCCIITTESIFKSCIYQVVIIVWLAYLASNKKKKKISPLALICLSYVIYHMQEAVQSNDILREIPGRFNWVLNRGDVFYVCTGMSHSTKDLCLLVSKALFHRRLCVCWEYITPRILVALSDEGALTSNGRKKKKKQQLKFAMRKVRHFFIVKISIS